MNYPLTLPSVHPPPRFARFLRRPNRFVVEIELVPEGHITTASMPNPGRMQEILLPGTTLGIRPGPEGGRHPWRVHTLHRQGATIPLDTGAANRIARTLLEYQLVPGLEDRAVVRAEVTPAGGTSRFDFELAGATAPAPHSYLEVKSCTLFNGPWALFPDAVTDRGRRHVEELAEHPNSAILFLVHSAEVQFFGPDLHVDLAFARTLYAHRHAVRILPIAVAWDQDMRLQAPPRLLPVPWDRIAPALEDRGSYVIVLYLPAERTIAVGALGERRFPAGYYVYVGSAMQHLSKRVARHRTRRRTHKHWHIDYFREIAEYITSYAIREPRRREHEIVGAIRTMAADSIPAFGSSDSPHPSHLFYFNVDPRSDGAFQKTLLALRRTALS